METITGSRIPNRFAIKYRGKSTPSEASDMWKPIVEISLSLVTRLGRALEGNNLKNNDIINESINEFVDVLGAVKEPNSESFVAFTNNLIIN